jgi:hypothetical protein
MRVDPDAAKLFRAAAGIDLLVEELGNSRVVERD